MLFCIPGELRNRIYRYALLKEDDFDRDPLCVDGNTHKLPGILKASRQLKNEATKIEENIFILCIYDLKFAPQQEHWIWKVEHANLFQEHHGVRSWANLTEWLKRFWEAGAGQFPRMPMAEDGDEYAYVIDYAFGLVAKLSELRWEKVAGVLETFRCAIETKSEDWEFD